MSDEESKIAVNVGNIHVDKAVVTNPRPDSKQTLLQMTPLLSLLITGLALVATSGLQWWQTHSSATQKTDEDWRAALDKVAETADPLVGSLEMQSFMSNTKYRNRAGSIIAVKLPKIKDKQEFDAAFEVVPERVDQTNQGILIDVARAITSNLQDQYNLVLKSLPADPKADRSFAAFVLDPEGFGAEGPEVETMLTETWKLDSTIHGLQTIWTRKGLTAGVSPQNMDLSGIEFYGADKPLDFTGVSFAGADLSDSEFIGSCIVTDPVALKVDRCATAASTPAAPTPPKPGNARSAAQTVAPAGVPHKVNAKN